MRKQLSEANKQLDKEIEAFTKAIRTAELNKLGTSATIEKINKELGR